MAAHWWWSWGIGLPVSAYADSQWSPSSLLTVATNNQTNLNSPSAGANAPGEEYNLQLTAAGFMVGPAFWNGALSTGWFIGRWNGNNEVLSNNASINIMRLLLGSTTVVALRSSSNTNPSTLNLFVNGTLIGTTTGAYGDGAVVLAMDFDLTQTPPEAGLVVDGVREIALAGGSGSPTTIDRVGMGGGISGGADIAFWGDPMVFGDLNDFPDVADTQDVWCTFMSVDQVTDPDASWTPSTTTDVGDISDHDETTYVSTTTDPDDLTIEYESTTDKYPGWGPTLIYGMASVAYATADVITNTTIELSDSGGLIDTTNDTANAVGRFIGVWVNESSAAAPLTAFDINSASSTYTVT